MNINQWPFYVSYSWETESQQAVVDKLEKDAQKFPKLKLIRDIEQNKPGDSIHEFIKKVGQAPRLVLVLSEPYFNSKYTLEEFAIALQHGGLNTRVRVVLLDGFRLDHKLKEQQKIQDVIDAHDVDLKLTDYEQSLELLGDSLVSVEKASESSDFDPVLQNILESYEQYPNPDIDEQEALINFRKTELQFLKRKIKQLFKDCDDLKPMQMALRENAIKAGVEGSIFDLLCPDGVGTTLTIAFENVFYPALCDALEAAQKSSSITHAQLNHLLKLLGWIVTAFVNDFWIKENKTSLSDYFSAPSVNLVLENGHLIELVIARAHERSANLKKSGRADFEGASGILFHQPDAASCTLEFVFQKLVARFIPDTEPSELTDELWEQLDTIIRLKRRKENIFVGFHLPDQWGNMKAELSDKLQCLPQFWIQGKKGDSGALLLVSEPKLNALIKTCITEIEEYRQYVKPN